MSQVKLLFPKNMYPIYRDYIDLLLTLISSDDGCISKSDIEILSIALGDKTHQLFKMVMSCEGVSEKLKTVFSHSVKLKIEILKWLFTTNTELTNKSNRAVVRLVLSQYQAQLEEINAHEQQMNLKALEEKKIKEAARDNQLRKEEAARNNRRRKEIEAFKASHVDFEDFEVRNIQKNSRVDKLLTQLRKKAITPEELKWLAGVGFLTGSVEKKYHLQLAHQHFQNWKQKSLPWELVNASAAYRKAEELIKIKKALDESYPFNIPKKEKKLKSALLTTYGGVCRDLKDYVNSIKLGLEAHNVTPLNFRPCTLLGAVYLSTGEFDLGHEWYGKAKERGFSQDAYDNDIKSVYFRASAEMKNRLKQNLISTGHSYKWLTDSK
jgi:tetratricopeptide (TPR) repeat protein